ncbi:serine/threonine-protein phosphatase [Telmatocola sphagniphila]|uniref:Serine/threonine-protein phosphatase n=1 Tax=Telmatocola sphagniphila TaxID=1123043 RepID=A0A8E6B9K6_9BACT|nr:protein phosphatase 2C domain-containing protein [Telmatocola sphagniphila]QVL32900.1 serine/threonine-protein phosphatase [Telmatocola sphagniphila]
MALSLNIGKCTLLGNYRENNEDSIEVKLFPDLIVCIVADGMGGQNAGEVASKKAIDIIPRELRKHLSPAVNIEQTKTIIRKAIVTANEEIMAMGSLDKEMKNMGTTVVVAVWRKGQELFVTGVGDSRTYLIRNRKISQLTVDHSLAQALVEAKTISAAEAREHKFRNVLWKYLGSKEVGDGPEVTVVPLQQGDRFLLCSDGLHGVVPDDKLLNFVGTQTDSQACADGLGQLALDSGSRDNVSCIIMDIL